MLRNEGDKLTRVVVCSPDTEYFDVDNCKAHNIQEVADREEAILQHTELRLILKDFGAEVINIKELKGHPNSVFTRDMAVSTPKGYLKLRMGIETRKGEETLISDVLDSLNEPCAYEIKAPGMVEGGDVIVAGRTAFIGRTQRTNDEGIRQFTEIMESMDYEVRIPHVPDKYLHLDQTIGVLGPNRLMYCSGLYPDELFEGFETVKFSCEDFNVNFICLQENEILAPASNTGVIKAAEDNGVKVHVVNLTEFAKGTGGPNCLIMPLERK